MPYSSLIRSTAAQPSQVGARSAASSSLTSASTAVATSSKRAATVSRKCSETSLPHEFAVELRAVEVVGADQIGAQHRTRYQAGDGGVEAGGGDEEVLAGAVGADAAAGVGENRDLGVEPFELLQRIGQFAGDRALAGPAVDEHDIGRVVVLLQPAQGVGVDAAAADDGDGVVGQVQAVPVLRPTAHQHADGGAYRASDTSTGRGDRSAMTVSVTVPTARAIRAADISRADLNSSWYWALGWYSTGSDSA